MVNEENDSVPENKGLKVVRELDFNKQKDILKKKSIKNFDGVRSFFEKINPDYGKFLKEEKRFHFYHFTTFDKLKKLICENKLVLGYPPKWYDSVDRKMMELYSNSCEGGKQVYASCVTMRKTSLMWQCYAKKTDSVMITFKGSAIKKLSKKCCFAPVWYVPYLDRKENMDLIKERKHLYPFIKRFSYQDEREWRIISTEQEIDVRDSADLIESISISKFAFEKKKMAACQRVEQEKERLIYKIEQLKSGVKILDDRTFLFESILKRLEQ